MSMTLFGKDGKTIIFLADSPEFIEKPSGSKVSVDKSKLIESIKNAAEGCISETNQNDIVGKIHR